MLRSVLYFLPFCFFINSQAENLIDEWKDLKEEYGLNLQTIYSFDERDFNTLSVYTAAYKLPGNFSFREFTDSHGNQKPPRNRARLTRSFSEYRLIYNLRGFTGSDRFAIEAECNFVFFTDEHTMRFSPTYKYSVPFLPDGSWIMWRFFPIETSDNMEMSWAWKFVTTDKWSITGFADYNIDKGQKDRWIVEPQLNITGSMTSFLYTWNTAITALKLPMISLTEMPG